MQSHYPGTFKEIFSTFRQNKDYSCDFLRIINNHYIEIIAINELHNVYKKFFTCIEMKIEWKISKF